MYQVAIWARQDAPFTLKDLAVHLLRPQFVLYLGRKSCPLCMPLQAQVVNAESMSEAFHSADFIPLELFLEQLGCKTDFIPVAETVSLFWDDDVESGIEARETFIRRDKILSRSRWQFAEQRENHATRQKQEG
jgi:CRISPR system Cascade subunit CasD